MMDPFHWPLGDFEPKWIVKNFKRSEGNSVWLFFLPLMCKVKVKFCKDCSTGMPEKNI